MIRNNNTMFYPWDISNPDGSITKISNEAFYAYCQEKYRSGIMNNNLNTLGEALYCIEKFIDDFSIFYRQNRQEIDRFKEAILFSLRVRFNESRSSTSPSSDNSEESRPSTSSSNNNNPKYPIYLGNHRWKVGPSVLDECD